MKRFGLFVVLLLFSVMVFGAGGKERLGNPEDISEIFQLCQQLGVDENTTITVEECTEAGCTTYKVVCSLDESEQ